MRRHIQYGKFLALLGLAALVFPHASATAAALVFAPGAPAQSTGVEKSTTVFGVNIHYREAGSGPTVILLHGLGGDSTNWAANIAPLAEKFRVIAIDQVGFGKSDKPFLSYRVGTLVDFLHGFYSALDIKSASLVGNSLGGWTAALFSIKYPEMVDGLVLVCSAGFALAPDTDPNLPAVLTASTRESVRQLLSLIFYDKNLVGSDAAVDLFFSRRMTAGDGYTVHRFIESIVRGEDVLDGRLHEIKSPALIIWGRHDGLTPLELGRRFEKEIKGSRLVIFEECGHVPQMEHAGRFNSTVTDFLTSHATGSSQAR